MELREDAPLKTGSGGARQCGSACGGARAIAAGFAALSAAVTVALLAQLWGGPTHGEDRLRRTGVHCTTDYTISLMFVI